jgi:Cu(I)/Ag(I) efflux system membrane protein CusA/SilA
VSTGTGSEIMERIAVPMIGGIISSTLLSLIVIPAIFGLIKGFRLPSEDRPDTQPSPLPTQSVELARRVAEPLG